MKDFSFFSISLCPVSFQEFFFGFIYGGVCCCYYCYLSHCVLRVILKSSQKPGIMRFSQVQAKCGTFREKKSLYKSAQLFHFCTMRASVPLIPGLVPDHLCHDQCSSCCDLSGCPSSSITAHCWVVSLMSKSHLMKHLLFKGFKALLDRKCY